MMQKSRVTDIVSLEKLSPKKAQFVLAMLSERDVIKASSVAGITERTGYRWVKDKDIVEAFRQANASMFSEIQLRLVSLGEKAVRALESVLDSDTSTYHEKIRASDIVLSKILDWKAIVEFEERISALEKGVASGE